MELPQLAKLDLAVFNLGPYGSISLLSLNTPSLFLVANQRRLDVGGMAGRWIVGTQRDLPQP